MESVYIKSTFCIYGLHSLHRQFSNFQFFTSLLKLGAQVHELPKSHCGDNREGTLFS